MAKVTLIEGTANITPWGQRCEADREFECLDEKQLAFFRSNRRYRVGEPPPRPPVRARRAPAPEPAAQPAPEPASEPAASSADSAPGPDPDLSILDGSISALTKALKTGEYDDVLDLLKEAEEAGKTRKGAIAAIEEREDYLTTP